MAKKRKTLPKEFEEIIRSGDTSALKAVFNKCEINYKIINLEEE